MKTFVTRIIALIAFMAIFASTTFGQGFTSASLNGKITDTNGEPLIGANVVALHEPSGTVYGNSTNENGYFGMPNLRVGGPYTLTVTYTGFEDFVKKDVYLQLGQSFKLDAQLSDAAVELVGALVTATRDDVFDGNRTGAETNVNEREIATLPTLSRSLGDFVRTTPQATVRETSDGFSISVNGMNNRYNAIYIDGAVNNDVFGLARSGTNGGQTGVSPFSLDAIEQIQISVAPFDVRIGGFAGGAINAITRSGTNNLEGSVYYFLRNESMAGKTPTDNPAVERVRLDDFAAKTYGFRLGGPLIKNKLFFFVNTEIQRDDSPLPFDFNQYQGNATQADLSALAGKLNGLGYDPGPYDANSAFLKSEKVTVKLDYNLNQNNKISFRHGYVKSRNLEGLQSNSRTINFLNASEFFVSKTFTSSLEWNSVIGSNMANNLKLGYIRVRDDRDPSGQPFPYVNIDDGNGASIIFGSERFSTANGLDQDIYTITDNFQIYKGKHNLTFGTHNEFYDVYNLFIPFNFGSYEFDSLDDFMNDANSSFYIRSYSLRDNITGDGSAAAAIFNSGQLGFYVQDEFQVTNNFKLTAGVRVDIPFFDDTPVNESFNATTIPILEQVWDLRGAKTGSFIKTQALFAPRVGFNWDVTGEQKTQVRGGIGVFTSRVPLVWPGGSYNNYGFNRGTVLRFGDLPFEPRFDKQIPGEIDPNNPTPSGDIDLFAHDFKIPQVVKGNIAIDQKLPWGLIGNIDFIYNKTINNVAYQNVNLGRQIGTLTGTGDNRPIYNRRDEIDDTYSRVILGYNTSRGYSWNFTASVTKPFDNGFAGSFAYSYGNAKSVFDGTSSQNSSQWRGLHSVRGRNIDQPLTRSDFAQGSRFIGSVSYKVNWNKGKNVASTVSFFYEGIQGQPYSYTYNDRGGLTNEDSRERSLIYVPRDMNDIVLVESGGRTPEQQWTDLNAFIEGDSYLKGRRGQYAEHNAKRGPWSNVIDFKFLQDFTVYAGGKSHTFQFTLDIFNLTNLINNDWGRRRFVFSDFELLDFKGFQDDPNTGEATTTPTFAFGGVKNNDPSTDNIVDSGVASSRWQMQIGLRYIFK